MDLQVAFNFIEDQLEYAIYLYMSIDYLSIQTGCLQTIHLQNKKVFFLQVLMQIQQQITVQKCHIIIQHFQITRKRVQRLLNSSQRLAAKVYMQVQTWAAPATLFPAGSEDIGGVGAPVFAAGRWAAISGRRSYSISGNIVATALRKTSHF